MCPKKDVLSGEEVDKEGRSCGNGSYPRKGIFSFTAEKKGNNKGGFQHQEVQRRGA